MSALGSILVCRLSALGDVVLTLPVVHALREAYPSARLEYLSREPYGRVLQGVRELDALHLWKGPGALLSEEVTGHPWDALVDLSATGRSRRLLTRVHAARVLRAKKESLRRLAFVKLRWLGAGGVSISPAVDRMFAAVAPLGLTRDGRIPRFDNDAPPADGPVLLAPGGARETKRWPVENFGEVGRRLQSQGRDLVALGGPGEEDIIDRMCEGLERVSKKVALDPSELPRVVSGCSLAITNDSGVLHVAEACGVPVIAIFGPTHPRLGFAPACSSSAAVHSGIECSPCDLHGPRRCPKGHHRCMKEVSVERILAELTKRIPSGVRA